MNFIFRQKGDQVGIFLREADGSVIWIGTYRMPLDGDIEGDHKFLQSVAKLYKTRLRRR